MSRIIPPAGPVLLVLLAVWAAGHARADVSGVPDGPRVIGTAVPLALETPHPYPAGLPGGPAGVVWRWRMAHPGATYLTVHLARIELAPGDHLAVLDASGKEQGRLTGRGPVDTGQAWTPAVDGDVLILELHASGGGTPGERFGLAADRYAHGFEPLAPVGDEGAESICGTDQRRDVQCYQSTYPQDYGRARAVGRLLINGVGTCTGWLLSCQGHMMTAAHCVADQASIQNTQVRMLYERSGCGTGEISWDRTLNGKTLVRANGALDYTLFTLVEDASEYGFFGLDPRLPKAGERIYIPAHHSGIEKKFGIESDNEPEGVCRVTESPWLLDSTVLDYYCDIVGSSSGAPVVSGITHRVLALNRTETSNCLYGNQGRRIDLILPEIRNDLPACSFAPDLSVQSVQVLDGGAGGNGNGYADPGETFQLRITLGNRGTSPATAVGGTLSTAEPKARVEDAAASFADVPDGGTGSTVDPHFTLRLSRAIACGFRVPLRLALATAEGEFTFDIVLPVGQNLGGPVTQVSDDTPRAIPNGNPAGVTSTITFGQGFTIADAFVRPEITHTYIGDLSVELTSPAGTKVRLHAKTGWQRDNLDDWYDREVQAAGPGEMSDFDGQFSAGNWSLKVIDDVTANAGNLVRWTLELHRPDNFVCSAVGGAATPGEASAPAAAPLRVPSYDPTTGRVAVSFAPACNANDHVAYAGPLAAIAGYAWDASACGLGTAGTASFDPGPGSRFFVIVGEDGATAGSYGRSSAGSERPEAGGLAPCDRPQNLFDACP